MKSAFLLCLLASLIAAQTENNVSVAPESTTMEPESTTTESTTTEPESITTEPPISAPTSAPTTPAEVSREILLVANGSGIFQVNFHDRPLDSNFTIRDPTRNFLSVDCASDPGEYVWTDSAQKIIFVGNEKSQREILTSSGNPIAVAVDWMSQNVYYINKEGRSIGVVSLNGRYHAVLVKDVKKPWAIAVDPEAGYMFWTDRGVDRRIERADMNGENRRVIVDRSPNGAPTALALDRVEKKVYWMDEKHNSIEYCDYNGENCGIALEGVGNLKPFALAVTDTHFVWSDTFHSAVFSSERTPPLPPTPDTFTTLYNGSANGIAVCNPNGTRKGSNCCSVNNGGCKQLCLPGPNFTCSCACPSRGELQSDGKSCLVTTDATKYLLVADIDDVRAMDVETLLDVHPPIVGLREATALDVDPKTNSIYFVSKGANWLRRISRAGVVTLIGPLLTQPFGVAVDWIGRQVYFTDGNRIGVTKMHGHTSTFVVRNMASTPRDIALDLKRGLMFWTSYDASGRNTGKIERAPMSGSVPADVAYSLSEPNGLTLDTENEIVYWVDTKRRRVEKANYDGSNRAIVADALRAPYDIALSDGILYWTDQAQKRKNIMQMPADNSSDPKPVAKASPPFSRPSGLVVYDKGAYSNFSNECSKNNGGCRMFCAPQGTSSRRCFCPLTRPEPCKPVVKLTKEADGSVVRLKCEVCRAGIFLWHSTFFKGSTKLQRRFGTVADCVLHIRRIDRADPDSSKSGPGDYYCVGVNKFGVVKSNVVTVAPLQR